MRSKGVTIMKHRTTTFCSADLAFEKVWGFIDKLLRAVTLLLYIVVTVPAIMLAYVIKGLLVVLQTVICYTHSLEEYREAAGAAITDAVLQGQTVHMFRHELFPDADSGKAHKGTVRRPKVSSDASNAEADADGGDAA